MEKRTKNDNSGQRGKSRLNILLSASSKDRIDRVVEQTGAETVTEAVRDAFRLLEFFVKVQKGNGKIFIQMPDEEAKQVEILGIVD